MPEDERIRNLIAYSTAENIEVDLVFNDDNVWASQRAISQIFNTDQSGIARHLSSVFESGELVEQSSMQKMHTANSSKPVKFYSLDTIISVGYRVNSKEATKFRIWANGVLKQYIRDGFVINEELLRSDPGKLSALAAQIRERSKHLKSPFVNFKNHLPSKVNNANTSLKTDCIISFDFT